MKKIPRWIIIVLVIALLIGSKFIFFSKKEEKPAGPAKDRNSLPVAVNYYVTRPVPLNNDVYTIGKIGAFNQIDIFPEVNGRITAIYFKEGETVKKGALLVKLNDADLQAQLLKVKNQLKLSEQKLGRLKQLITINGVSQEELEMQENEYLTFKADEAFISAQLAKTSITAPFDGVVGLKNISEGSFVNSSAPMVSLVQLRPLFVEFSIPEKYGAVFKKGLGVNFTGDDTESAETFSAGIYAVEPKVDEATKTIRARAVYNGNKEFYPGSFVKVFVNMGQTKDALMIPTPCVVATLKGQKVFVNRNGVAAEVPVKIGVRTDKMIQVLEGLSAGDTVITTGLLSVKKDSKLKLLKPVN
jgi:membrane fusion protein (multidrug efflux system)